MVRVRGASTSSVVCGGYAALLKCVDNPCMADSINTPPVSAGILTRAELARQLGVDRAIVTRDAKRGMPTHAVDAAKHWRDANLNPASRKEVKLTRRAEQPTALGTALPLAPVMDGGFMQERSRREKANADMAELRVKKQAGLVIDREPAERAVFDAFRELRDSIIVMHQSVAHELAQIAEPRAIALKLEAEFRRTMGEFEQQTRRRLAALAARE